MRRPVTPSANVYDQLPQEDKGELRPVLCDCKGDECERCDGAGFSMNTIWTRRG